MKKINTYEELFATIEAANELVEELKEDANVKSIETIKAGDGYWVRWTE